ncbi:MAG: hypothetical protein JXK05_13035 [Campylobacterales bacterium]|nr:hypothetical protein [Campylobacterales bacterium]
MNKILLSLSCTLALGASEITQAEFEALKAEVAQLKAAQNQSQEGLIEEMASLRDAIYSPVDEYTSFSAMGQAASKVYHSKSAVSIGGYGEYRFKKYTDFKNYASDTANETRRKAESNIVRFVPYIGFRFNDWIVMNTEIEFEDGGARSDGEKNYKYAIVEFSYLDFLIDPAFSVRVGHVLVPMGQINLNHEPVAFLSTERPVVESWIIPSTWHANGLLAHGVLGEVEYYAGVVNAPDAGGFEEGRYIQLGRQGARVFSDDFGFVARLGADVMEGLSLGGSLFYGTSSVVEESAPGVSTGLVSDAKVDVMLGELHASYIKEGWNIQALLAMGTLGSDAEELPQGARSQSVNGAYVNVGYNVLRHFATSQQLFVFGELERLDMDADATLEYPDNHRFLDTTAGVAYYPDPKVALKADYMMRDYGDDAKLSDEAIVTLAAGFIF